MLENDAMPLYPPANTQMPNKTLLRPSVTQPMPAPPATPILQPQPLLLGPENTVTTCPFCNAHIKTAVSYTTTTATHIAAAHYALICCCCWLPYVLESTKNSDHYCPHCQRYLGTYRR